MNNIRQALPEDRSAICSFDQIAQQSDERRRFIHEAIKSDNAWIALADGNVVGYLVLEHSFYGRGFISMVYIHPDHRRQGIASALLQHAETICRSGTLFTSTNQSNTSMQSLLNKMQFKPSGRIENLDEGDPELVFCKHLNK